MDSQHKNSHVEIRNKKPFNILAVFKGRFTSQEVIQIFVYCAFPIHLWTILNMLRDVPSWALYMRYGEIFNTIAYTMSFALIETLILFLPAIFLGMLLPGQWVREKVMPIVSVLLLEGSLAATLFQFAIKDNYPKRVTLLAILSVLVLSMVATLLFPKIGQGMKWIAERVTILSAIYIFLDVLGLIVVILRNV